jgi:NTP pyrophosphatase (non-canonical NTP hydrolase)
MKNSAATKPMSVASAALEVMGQQQVADVLGHSDVDTPPAYRLLDVVTELGDIAAEVNETTGYGTDPTALSVREEDLGDALFALLALCEQLDVDADAALASALAKYDQSGTNGTPASGD